MGSDCTLAQLTLLINGDGELVIERKFLPPEGIKILPSEVAHIVRTINYELEDIEDEVVRVLLRPM